MTAASTISTFSAPDIHCSGCANAIRRALGSLAGVQEVAVDVEAKTVTLTQDGPGDPGTVLTALDGAGFPATRIENAAGVPVAGGMSRSCCTR